MNTRRKWKRGSSINGPVEMLSSLDRSDMERMLTAWGEAGVSNAETLLQTIEEEAEGENSSQMERVIACAAEIRRHLKSGDVEAVFLDTVRMMNSFQFAKTYDAIVRYELSLAGAVKGGSKPKRIPAVLAFIRAHVRKNPKATATDLLKSIPNDEDFSVPVGKAKLFRDLGQIIVIEKRLGVIREEFGEEHKGMVWKRVAEISPRSFRDYVTVVRKAKMR